MIEADIAAALLPLVDPHVYPTTLPQDVEYPAITYHMVDSSERHEAYGLAGVLDEDVEGQATLWQVVIWAKSYAQIARLAPQVRAALHALPTLHQVAAQDGYDNQAEVRTRVLEFLSWGDQLEPRDSVAAENGPISATLEAIRQTLAERLGVPVKHWDKTRRDWPLPGVLLRPTGIGLGIDTGDGRVPVSVTVEAKCLHGQQPLAVEQLAARAVAVIRDSHKWGMATAVAWPDEPTGSAAAGQPGPNGWRAWSVTFVQTIYLDDLPDDDGITPTNVLSSFSPEIGEHHEDKYEIVS